MIYVNAVDCDRQCIGSVKVLLFRASIFDRAFWRAFKQAVLLCAPCAIAADQQR